MSAPSSSAAETAATEATEVGPPLPPPSQRLPGADELGPPPREIDRFRILLTLGAGGMGVVYEAYDPRLERHVAVKLVHRRLSQREGTRLRREAQSLARLSHPNVVQVFEVGRGPQGVYLVMELVRGRSLRQWLMERTREPAEILGMFLQAAEGLAAAHAAGLVHRDFKPGNVLVGDDGRARVVDFGLARAGRTGTDDDAAADARGSSSGSERAGASGDAHGIEDDATLPASDATPAPSSARVPPVAETLGRDLVAARLTDHDAVLGTPAYMAPEQHLGRPLTAAADQFGFCVALYEALYRVHPFGPPEDRVRRVLAGEVRLPPSATRSVPAHVQAAILRGLSLVPGDRFPSMQALLEALRPPSSRRRLVLAGVAGTAALAALAWVVTPRADPCTAGPQRLATAWNDQREAARDGMLATGLPYAASTWERTEARLSAYGNAWLAAYARTCEAGVQGTLAAAELDHRMRCLDERRRAMGALVGQLASADALAVRHAIEAVGELPPAADCEGMQAPGGTLPAPPAETAAEVERLRERLAVARARYLVGQHAEGLAIVTELRRRVEAVGYPPLQAELELGTGMLHIRAGDAPAARERLEAAYFLAKELGHDRVALEASMNLVFVGSTLLSDVELARSWLDHAAAELPLAGTPSLQASYEGLRGVVAAQAQRHAEAAEHHRRAAELQAAVHGPDSVMVARALSNLGLALAWTTRFDEGVAALERAIEITERELGVHHPDLALYLTNLGVVRFNHGDPQALADLERALALRREFLEPDHLDIANTLEQLGRVHATAHRFDEARPLLERAIEIRRRKQGPEHLQLALALAAVGELQLQQSDEPAAERSFREAMEMAESVAPEHPAVSYMQGWLGETLIEQERHEEGIAELREALARTEAIRGTDHPELIGVLQALAGAALEQQRPAEALAYAERALAVGERAGWPASRIAIARWQVARALWDAGGDRARARALAEAVAETWKDDPAKARRLTDVEEWLAEHPGPDPRRREATPSAPRAPLP